MTTTKGFQQRLTDGDVIIVAEGYLFEFERRGLLKAGAFVPEVVLEKPNLVRELHEEFVRSGSDVVLAFTYYGHREKLRVIGREQDLEALNINALKIAREVANNTNTLMAGNISNSTIYERNNQDSIQQTEAMFKEQIEWAVQEKADFIVAETFNELGEAMLALQCIQKYGNGLPSVVTMSPKASDRTFDGVSFGDACKQLEDAGANVVGLNCGRGPATMMPLLREIRQVCKGPIAAVPVPYRTTDKEPNFQALTDPDTGKQDFPLDLPAHTCSRSQIRHWAEEVKQLGVQYVGLCCGNASHYLREVAEVYGRKPVASKYAPDMTQHYTFGNRANNKTYYTEGLKMSITSK
ncbi:betaine--homocysteine S-methyltransferase 1 [Patella vulgata]|uniref:betaine--homocysteine S-methyltransferase 1 n=1 Tax=Patella vulgata TaxID=6465 RepID=UPI0021804643|nr:betaine--homocysteine S-methyltransferase 1 [Patella vulgata]XP_055958406.1 betaine--homocysteine S-methyltransferase 1 [Patella vulgata]